MLILFILITTRCNNFDIDTSQTSQDLLQSSQYYFLPQNSFFQYSLANWQEEFNAELITKINATFSIIISNNANSISATYNFLVFSSNEQQGQSQLNKYNCYVRAINEGIPAIMQSCNLTIAPTSNGKCNKQIQEAASNLFNTSYLFINCQDRIISYSIPLDQRVNSLNGAILFIIDNSGLIPQTNPPSSMINFILTYSIDTSINQEDKAKFMFFFALAGSVVFAMAIIVLILCCKIRKLDYLINNFKVKQN